MSSPPLTARRALLAAEGVALALLGAGLVFLLLGVVPLARQVESLSSAIETQQATAKATAEESDTHRFLRSLPHPARREIALARLPEDARRHGLKVGQMSVDDPIGGSDSAPLSSLAGRIVVVGSYENIRQWVVDSIKSSPGIAIGALQIAPAQNRESALMARLDFVFHASATATPSLDDDPGLQPPPSAAPSRPTLDPFRVPTIQRAPLRHSSPPPEPAATLPYTYGGRLHSAGAELYLLVIGDQVIRARIGDTLPGSQYRLDGATVERLELTHLQSGRRHYLSIGKQQP